MICDFEIPTGQKNTVLVQRKVPRADPTDKQAGQSPQRPETPRGAEKRPGAARSAQEHPETPRNAKRRPETPRNAQRRPETPRSAQKRPEAPRSTEKRRETDRAKQGKTGTEGDRPGQTGRGRERRRKAETRTAKQGGKDRQSRGSLEMQGGSACPKPRQSARPPFQKTRKSEAKRRTKKGRERQRQPETVNGK